MTSDLSLDNLFDQWKRRIDRLISEHPLQIISWEATRRCNLHCVHCGSPSEEVDVLQELTTDEVIGAFDQIANDFDMSQFHHVNITGGEPFVRKDLIEVLQGIGHYPFYRNIDIQTNGVVLAENPGLLNELKKFGVTGLGISIDGFEKTHDSFRGMIGCFAKASQAARMAVEKGYTVTVSLVAHDKNIDEIPSFFAWVKKEIRPRIFRVMTIDAQGRAENNRDYALSSANLRLVIHFLKDEFQSSCQTYANPDSTMVELGCGGWLGKELEGTVRPFIFHCIAGLNNLGILFDGKLGSCSNIDRAFIQGDLRKERIKTIWEEKFQIYRDHKRRKTGVCADCSSWEYCHGGPMHKRRHNNELAECILLNLEANR